MDNSKRGGPSDLLIQKATQAAMAAIGVLIVILLIREDDDPASTFNTAILYLLAFLAALAAVFFAGRFLQDWDGDTRLMNEPRTQPKSVKTDSKISSPATTARKEKSSTKSAASNVSAEPVAAAAVSATDTNDDPDDLTEIEGVGPKIAQLLVAAGYSTFQGVAKADSKVLKKVMQDAGDRFKMHDPSSWPQQAGLAAEGEWAKLADLQDELDGGR